MFEISCGDNQFLWMKILRVDAGFVLRRFPATENSQKRKSNRVDRRERVFL